MGDGAVQTVSLERFMEALSGKNFSVSVNSEIDDAFTILDKLGLDTGNSVFLSGAIQFRYLITETSENHKSLPIENKIEKTLEKIRQDMGLELSENDVMKLIQSCTVEDMDNTPKIEGDKEHKTPDPIELKHPTSYPLLASI